MAKTNDKISLKEEMNRLVEEKSRLSQVLDTQIRVKDYHYVKTMHKYLEVSNELKVVVSMINEGK